MSNDESRETDVSVIDTAGLQVQGYGACPEGLEDEEERIRYYRKLEVVIRGSFEMKNYVSFLKREMDMSRCAVMTGVNAGEKTKIELHHHPFTLMDVVDAVHRRREASGESLSSMAVCREVVQIHYRNLVGLVPLSETAHELYHSGRLEVDIRSVFGDVRAFAIMYNRYLDKRLAAKVRRMLRVAREGSADRANAEVLRLSAPRAVDGPGSMKQFLLED